jgi:hypothetical protein
MLALLKGKACKALCGQKISLFGVLISSRKHRSEVSKTINITELDKGIYFLKVKTASGGSIEKIIKE